MIKPAEQPIHAIVSTSAMYDVVPIRLLKLFSTGQLEMWMARFRKRLRFNLTDNEYNARVRLKIVCVYIHMYICIAYFVSASIAFHAVV